MEKLDAISSGILFLIGDFKWILDKLLLNCAVRKRLLAQEGMGEGFLLSCKRRMQIAK